MNLSKTKILTEYLDSLKIKLDRTTLMRFEKKY